jgi:5-formyltetrahydrofolate cyclo-ligase
VSKDELRQKYKALRKNISPAKRAEYSSVIVKKLKQFITNKSPNKVAIYFPTRYEVDISQLFKFLKSQKTIEIFAPYLHTNLGEDWFVAQFENFSQIEKTQHKILQPAKPKRIFKNFQTAGFKSGDIILVPGIAFSKKGGRVGYGEGIYDRLLSKTKSAKIGVCFDNQICEDCFLQEHDISVDSLCTNKSSRKARSEIAF